MKKLRFPLLISLIMTIVLLISAVPAPLQMKFYYEYRPGATYKMTVDMDNQMTMEFKGEGMEGQAALAAVLQNMKELVTMQMEQKFGAPDKDGNLPFESRLVDYTMKIYMGGIEMPMPAEREKQVKDMMLQVKWIGKMTKRGKVTEISSPEMDKMIGSSAKEAMDVITSFPEFPEKELAAGEDFTYSFTRPLKFGQDKNGMNAEITINYHYHLKDIREGSAHFDVKADYQMAGSSGSSRNFTIKGSGTGYAMYDVDKHFFAKMNLDNDYSLITAVPATKKSEDEGKEAEPSQMIMKIKQNMTTIMTIAE